jgi:DNA-binding HxlR family transcriptional regulator
MPVTIPQTEKEIPSETDGVGEALPWPLSQESSARKTLDLLSDKWSALILYALQPGKQRFGQLRRGIEGISEKMLIQTLKRLKRDGLVTRHMHHVVPPIVEYRLTTLGASLYETMTTICRWGREHIHEVEEARRLADAECAELRDDTEV